MDVFGGPFEFWLVGLGGSLSFLSCCFSPLSVVRHLLGGSITLHYKHYRERKSPILDHIVELEAGIVIPSTAADQEVAAQYSTGTHASGHAVRQHWIRTV